MPGELGAAPGGRAEAAAPRSRPGYETAGEGPVPLGGRSGARGAEAAGAQVRAGWSFRPGRGGAGPGRGLRGGPARGPEAPDGGRCLGKSLHRARRAIFNTGRYP